MTKYVVWCPDLGQEQEDGATIPATDPADAAEGWAEWHDRSSAEYRIASGREEIVIVRDVETGEQREWIVRGEAMPYYTAQPGESATIRAQVDAVSHMNQWVTAGFHTENGEDMANTMANTIATWTLELNCECPGCGEDVDLLDHADFWHGRNLAVGESSTERSRDVEVVCPACGHEFAVDCRY